MAEELEELQRRNLRRVRRPLALGQGPRIRLHGRELINFASNDYLNLASDPRLARAASRAARRYGCGAGASPLVAGHLPPHRRLEKQLAQFEGEEAALVFSSGFAANLAVLSSLAGPDDAIFSDQLNHASLIDGCRLSRASTHIYRHADVEHLDKLLRRHGGQARRRVIVTDGVFSMEGDLVPLPDLVKLADRYEAMLVVDEAHATGVLGPHGRGLAESLTRLPKAGLIKIGTLSKALGAQGGFVCGPRVLCDWLVNHARPYIFSTALAPPTCAAACRAVQIVQEDSEPRWRLLHLAEALRQSLRAEGLDTGTSSSQIVPVMVGEPETALELSRRLQVHGFLVPAIRPPSVPPGTSRLRISLTAGHGVTDIEALARAIAACAPSPNSRSPRSMHAV